MHPPRKTKSHGVLQKRKRADRPNRSHTIIRAVKIQRQPVGARNIRIIPIVGEVSQYTMISAQGAGKLQSGVAGQRRCPPINHSAFKDFPFRRIVGGQFTTTSEPVRISTATRTAMGWPDRLLIRKLIWSPPSMTWWVLIPRFATISPCAIANLRGAAKPNVVPPVTDMISAHWCVPVPPAAALIQIMSPIANVPAEATVIDVAPALAAALNVV